MKLTRKQFEFLKFVQGGDDWHSDCFIEIVEKYFQGRKNGCLTNPPFPHRAFNHSDNSVNTIQNSKLSIQNRRNNSAF